MARSPVAIFNGAYPNIKGLDELQGKVAAIPEAVYAEVKPALDWSGDKLVNTIRPLVPVGDDLERQPGELRDSLHVEPGRHDLSIVVTEDARDEKGHLIGLHVEQGHKAIDGSHVDGKPHFWPGYNLAKKAIRNRLNRAMNAGIKKAWAKT